MAVRNILGEHHDLWQVNTERSYHEEFTLKEPQEHPVKSQLLAQT